MKTTIDTNYANMDFVKSDLKEFKARYTDGDLLREFLNATDGKTELIGGVPQILKCTVEAFGSISTSFVVNLIIDTNIYLYKIGFYTDLDLNIDMSPLLITFRKFAEK